MIFSRELDTRPSAGLAPRCPFPTLSSDCATFTMGAGQRTVEKQGKTLQGKGVSEKITAGQLYDCQFELFLEQIAGGT